MNQKKLFIKSTLVETGGIGIQKKIKQNENFFKIDLNNIEDINNTHKYKL